MERTEYGREKISEIRNKRIFFSEYETPQRLGFPAIDMEIVCVIVRTVGVTYEYRVRLTQLHDGDSYVFLHTSLLSLVC